MDVADITGRPLVEEMLADRLDPFEDGTVDPIRIGGEASLRTRDPNDTRPASNAP